MEIAELSQTCFCPKTGRYPSDHSIFFDYVLQAHARGSCTNRGSSSMQVSCNISNRHLRKRITLLWRYMVSSSLITMYPVLEHKQEATLSAPSIVPKPIQLPNFTAAILHSSGFLHLIDQGLCELAAGHLAANLNGEVRETWSDRFLPTPKHILHTSHVSRGALVLYRRSQGVLRGFIKNTSNPLPAHVGKVFEVSNLHVTHSVESIQCISLVDKSHANVNSTIYTTVLAGPCNIYPQVKQWNFIFSGWVTENVLHDRSFMLPHIAENLGTTPTKSPKQPLQDSLCRAERHVFAGRST